MHIFKVRAEYIIWSLLFFLLCAFPSVINYPAAKAFKVYGQLFGGSILFFAIFKAVQIPHHRLRCFIKAVLYLLIIFTAVAAVKGIYQYQFLHIERPRSVFTNVNIFAMYMEISIPIVISALLSKKNLYVKIISCLILLSLFGGMVITMSRGAWISLALAIILMIIVTKNYKILLIASVPMILSAAIGYERVVSRLQTIFDLQMQGNAERLHGYYSSLEIIKANPLTGIGFNNFGNIYPQFMLPTAKEVLPHAHNLVLAYATEAGILTAIAFCSFIGLAGLYVYQNYSNITDNNNKLLVLGVTCGLFAILLHGTVDYTLGRSDLFLTFIYLAGVVIGMLHSYTKGNLIEP